MNEDAWKTLTLDEQTALTLKLGMEKSTWEVGEIVGKSHYKYLEIQYRAKHFLKLFTDHLELYDRLVPDFMTGDKLVIKFFQKCIEYRKKPMRVIEELNQVSKITKGEMNKKIIDQMRKWDNSDNANLMNIHDFIKEFDRWNNFRILPKAIQEPSAYKRRVKNVYKKHLKIITNIHPLSLKKLLKLYNTKNPPFLYMPIINNGKPEIWKMKVNQQSMKIFNEIGFYLFKRYEHASEYIQEVEAYVGKKKKECIDGLNFWPKYRDLIATAQNYMEVQKISPNRKFLDKALSKLEYL